MSWEPLTRGELRSLLHRPSLESWEELLLQLYMWSYEERRGEQAFVLPYCARQIATWPQDMHLLLNWRWLDIKDGEVRSEILRWVVSREQPLSYPRLPWNSPREPPQDYDIEPIFKVLACEGEEWPALHTLRDGWDSRETWTAFGILRHRAYCLEDSPGNMLPYLQRLSPTPGDRDEILRLARFIAVDLFMDFAGTSTEGMDHFRKRGHKVLAEQLLPWIRTPYHREQLMELVCTGDLTENEEQMVIVAHDWIELWRVE